MSSRAALLLSLNLLVLLAFNAGAEAQAANPATPTRAAADPVDPVAGFVASEAAVLILSGLATVGLAVMWIAFWLAVARSGESITHILQSSAFFRTVTVMGVIAATVVLSLAGRLEGNITGAVLSGIVGYVLGAVSQKEKGEDKPRKMVRIAPRRRAEPEGSIYPE